MPNLQLTLKKNVQYLVSEGDPHKYSQHRHSSILDPNGIIHLYKIHTRFADFHTLFYLLWLTFDVKTTHQKGKTRQLLGQSPWTLIETSIHPLDFLEHCSHAADFLKQRKSSILFCSRMYAMPRGPTNLELSILNKFGLCAKPMK
jgi:hypothetical protein